VVRQRLAREETAIVAQGIAMAHEPPAMQPVRRWLGMTGYSHRVGHSWRRQHCQQVREDCRCRAEVLLERMETACLASAVPCKNDSQLNPAGHQTRGERTALVSRDGLLTL
jgi:hypothetical protein